MDSIFCNIRGNFPALDEVANTSDYGALRNIDFICDLQSSRYLIFTDIEFGIV